MNERKTLGEAIFVDIESNVYLNELHEKILYNYALKLFQLNNVKQPKEFELKDALRFADLLSKSTHPTKSDVHKMWAQEIIILLNEIEEENPLVKLYAGSVFSSTGNHQGLQLINSEYQNINTFEKIFAQFRSDYLTIPAAPEMKFFSAQKEAYDHLSDPCFSYSGPTSMGKSFIMRMFIKDEVLHDAKKNYALIVPTKALINEVRSKIINDLENNLKKCNYRVVTAASDIALEEEHNFVFVLTPERLLYLLISNPDLQIDYLFIDEAHKLSGKNSRGPFYYKVVDMLLRREHKSHFIFASPNIPNPEVYLRLMNEVLENNDESKLASTYSPVIQVKFLMDFINGSIDIYNERSDKVIHVAKVNSGSMKLNEMLLLFEAKNLRLSSEKRSQTIVYYNGRNKAIEAARNFADTNGVDEKHDPELDSLSKDITQEVHGDYYLAGMIKKGVAYHIGYLPASIRTRIEELFQKGKITTMFCTSTLLEGVNLPADNLFITDNKIFRHPMSPVDFRNLIGRVGRISYNLYGNVFLVSEDSSVTTDNYVEMLKQPIPEQSLSIATDPKVLKPIEKKYIAEILKSGSSEIPQRVNSKGEPLQTEESYVMMRKFGLVLLKDIMEERNTLVHREFADFLTPEDEQAIREKFKESPTLPDDDINTSVDQTKKLIIAIKKGLKYPSCNGGFRYNEIIEFFDKLSAIFDWPTYEKSTLGNPSKRKWYAVILSQWMDGWGLSYIMKRALEHHKKHPDNFRVSRYQPPTTYNDNSKEHRNIVFADTLEVIENTVLFSISNYFLRFSNEYKKVHNVTEFDNNWYEYVEFGTTNPLTILLQRNGFSRESATYIRNYKDEYVVHDGDEEDLKLKSSLLHCGNTSVMTEAASIKFNVPGLFIDDMTESDEIDEGLSFVRTIQCPECNTEFEVDLAEYVYDVSGFEKDNGMGPDAVHSFDSESNCKCPYCGKVLNITGWIREYPIGTLDSEEINIDTFDDE